jgi:hypothetical protein
MVSVMVGKARSRRKDTDGGVVVDGGTTIGEARSQVERNGGGVGTASGYSLRTLLL